MQPLAWFLVKCSQVFNCCSLPPMMLERLICRTLKENDANNGECYANLNDGCSLCREKPRHVLAARCVHFPYHLCATCCLPQLYLWQGEECSHGMLLSLYMVSRLLVPWDAFLSADIKKYIGFQFKFCAMRLNARDLLTVKCQNICIYAELGWFLC